METWAERSGWVLAGGKSSRMGTDKALIDFHGKPLARVVAERLAEVCGTVSLVGDPERYAGIGLPAVPDNFPGLGPLSGIEAALSATETDWNLVVACDMPALDVSIVQELFERALLSPGTDCAMPRHKSGAVEPLCAVYHRRCHPAMVAAIDRGVRKVTDALPPERLRYVQVASSASFANLNTPEDLHKYRNG